jgi:lipid A disaccharide synthetase
LRVDVGLQPLDAPLLAAFASSGTVTAEVATALVPMSVMYRVSWQGRMAGFLFFTAPFFALVNLVAGRLVVRERVVTRRSAAPLLAADLLAVAADPSAWARTRTDLVAVRRRLELPHVADRAARAILAGPRATSTPRS